MYYMCVWFLLIFLSGLEHRPIIISLITAPQEQHRSAAAAAGKAASRPNAEH
jgi:hypothetical protein